MITLLVIADAIAISIAWLVSFWVRFTFLPIDPAKGIPTLGDKFVPMLPLVVVAHLLIFYRAGLYRPRRDRGLFTETRDIVKAFVTAVVAVVLIDYAMPETNKISRQFIPTYALIGTSCFVIFRGAVRAFLQAARHYGLNRRTAAIVGTGRSAQKLLYALRRNMWTGVEVSYFVDDLEPDSRTELRELPIRTPICRLSEIIADHPVDSVFVALPADQSHRITDVLAQLETCTADVRMVPDISATYTMRPNVSSLDGVPILSLRQSPLYGWNAVLKRAFDVVIGLTCLLFGSVPMIVIALMIKLTSPGPVLYKQVRMGLDGCRFSMFKFRTMRQDAEAETGAVWAAPDDQRRTWLGRFLRRTSLDELPQLFNVLAGQMSLVGPRPERPEFINEFKERIPRYMLRHKMKAGMTGYAQVNGLRGNTSLRKRIRYDLHYIRHWSLGLDIRILALTLTGAWFSSHET